jgi:hypothetical protein
MVSRRLQAAQLHSKPLFDLSDRFSTGPAGESRPHTPGTPTASENDGRRRDGRATHVRCGTTAPHVRAARGPSDPATVCQRLPPSATVLPPSATVRPPSRVADRSLANSRFPEEIVHSAGVGHPCHRCHRRDHAFPHSDQISARHCRLCAAVQIVSDPRDSKKGGRGPFVFGHSRRRQAHHLSVRRRSAVVAVSCSAHDARSVSSVVKDRTCTARPGTVADHRKNYERYSQVPGVAPRDPARDSPRHRAGSLAPHARRPRTHGGARVNRS